MRLVFTSLTQTQLARLLFEVASHVGLPDMTDILDLVRVFVGEKVPRNQDVPNHALSVFADYGWHDLWVVASPEQCASLTLVRNNTKIIMLYQNDTLSLDLTWSDEGAHFLRMLAGWLILPYFAPLLVCCDEVTMSAGRWLAILALRACGQAYEASVLWDLAAGG